MPMRVAEKGRTVTAALVISMTGGLLGAQTPADTTRPLPVPPPTLEAARAAWEKAPTNVDSIVWYGRRMGYTGDFGATIDIYTEGLRLHPDDPQLLRHRGHRYLSVRNYTAALQDLQRARDAVVGRPDVVELDGQPNARGIPTSTLHSNIRYHLALAHFLLGDFPSAAAIWEEDAKLAANLDQRAAATFWWVVALARQRDGDRVREALAPVRADWEIIENGSYHLLLLWMKGERTDEQLRARMQTPLERQTLGNGMAQWYLARGRRATAEGIAREVLATGPSASFGFLAVEQMARELGIR